MISLLEIAQSINEADDDKYVSIGFGRFKLKGKEDDDSADVFVKTDSGKYVKSADQKSDDDGGKKPEEPQGGKLSGSDFDRDGGDEPDMDDDAEFAEKYGYDADASTKSFDDEEIEDIIDKMADDAGVSVDNPVELVKIVRNKDEYGNANLGDIHKHINDMADKPKGDDDNAESDDIEISDANSGPIDRDDIMDMLKNDSEVVKKMGDNVYWDGMDLVSSKFDDETIASIPDDSNMTLGDLKKQIMDYESLASLMYPKQYESVESINVNLKEKYDRIFRSLK